MYVSFYIYLYNSAKKNVYSFYIYLDISCIDYLFQEQASGPVHDLPRDTGHRRLRWIQVNDVTFSLPVTRNMNQWGKKYGTHRLMKN